MRLNSSRPRAWCLISPLSLIAANPAQVDPQRLSHPGHARLDPVRAMRRLSQTEDQRCEGNQKDGDKHTVTNYLLAAIRLCRIEPRDVWAQACAGLRSMPDVHDLNIDVSVLAVALDLQSHLFSHSDALKLIGQVWQSANRLAFDRHDHVP